MKEQITVTATGDSLFVANFPEEYEKDLQEIKDYIGQGDVRITNLETNLGKFGKFASAYSGGTWLNTEPKDFPYLLKFGFNYMGTANNHTMDYSYHGMASTQKILNKYRLAHSGTGNSLEEAGKAAEVTTKKGRIGVIAVTTSFENASKAGRKSIASEARPGVNYLRAKQYFPVEEEDLQLLKQIAKNCGINDERELDVADGYLLPDPEGLYTFGSNQFCTHAYGKDSECNAKDLERIVNSIKRAKENYDLVLVLIHSHEVKGANFTTVPTFLRDLSHACIDAGAAAMIGGGVHELRPVEIYNGHPIFYSLGDFIYQGMRVKYLPADFMEKYGVEDNATAWEGLMARSQNGKIGLQTKACNYRTVIPKMVFEDGDLVSLELLPAELGFDRKGDLNGLPTVARGDYGKEIFEHLLDISQCFGAKMSFNGQTITVEK